MARARAGLLAALILAIATPHALANQPEKPTATASAPAETAAAPNPRAAAHTALQQFLELFRNRNAESRKEMTAYLDASKLDETQKEDLPTRAARLAEFIIDNKLDADDVFERMQLAEDANEHCLFRSKPLVSQADGATDDDEDVERVCQVRLVRSDDGLWGFDAETVQKIDLLAAISDEVVTPVEKPAAKTEAPAAAPPKAEPAAEAPAAKPALEVPEQFRTPRATMRTFLQSFDPNIKTGVTPAECLNVGQRGLSPKDYWAQALSRGLKFVLDRTVWVQMSKLPDDPATSSPYVYRTIDEKWPISLERVEDGRWLFSAETLNALPDMIRAVADAPPKVANAPELSFLEMPELYTLLMVPRWARGQIWFLEIWQWIGLLVVIVCGIVCDRAAQFILRFVSRLIARRIDGQSGRDIGDKAFRPVGLVLMAYLWLMMLPLLWLPAWLGTLLTTVSWLVLIVAGIWATYRLIDIVTAFVTMASARRESGFHDLLVPFIRKLLKIVVTIVGLIFFFSRLYPNDVATLLGGLGIGGLAFALAAQDTIKNVFGSITVMLDRPFEIGDWVKIDDVEGTVESVGFRSTHIRTFYNSQINVPNGKLIDATVDNLGRRRFRRTSCTLGLTYDTTPEQIEAFCEGVRELIRRHPYTCKDMYHVYFSGFGAHSLDILLYCFFETPDWATELRERHRLYCDILRLAQRIGVEFAFPTQTLHLHNADAAPPRKDGMPARARELAPDIVGRSEAAAIAKLSVPPPDSLSPVNIKTEPQSVDTEYMNERLGIKVNGEAK